MPDLSIPFYLSYAALWVLVILHSLVLLGAVRIIHQLQQSGTAAGRSNLSLGEKAPMFSAADLSGTFIKSAEFIGPLTALFFVTTDCPACTEILEDMKSLNHKTQGDVIMICQSGRQDCARLVEQYGLNMPVIVDENARISRLYNIFSVPTIVAIDSNNIVQAFGQLPIEEVEDLFNKVS